MPQLSFCSAYLAQHLIVLLDPADIVVNLHHAYRRPEFDRFLAISSGSKYIELAGDEVDHRL